MSDTPRYQHATLTKSLLACGLIFASVNLHASLLNFEGLYGSELEERSAVSNQRVYDELKAQGCGDGDRNATEDCAGTTFIVWNNVRELVHTANELSNNNQPTLFSLNLALPDLGFALRWTAGEEFSSEGSLSNSFVNGQLSGLASRVSAIRSGARGFNLAGLDYEQTGVNAGDTDNAWSRWGGFINGSYTYGDQEATEREDAFDFDGQEINAGLDYRLDDHWVVGGLFGYQSQEIEFDPSQSIVDGGVEMDAFSLIGFALYQADKWYYSGSLGYQLAQFDTDRSIRYPSLNPDTDNTDTVATSSNDANIFSVNLTAGYSFAIGESFTIEPSVAVNYQDVTIEAYTEQDISNDGFNFIIDEQNYDSLETIVNLRAQYVISSRFGVFIPYANIGFYAQQETDPRFINAKYGDASSQLTDAAKFSLPTDGQDGDYKIWTLGMSSVIRGASQKTLDGPASGGIQLYVNYREIEDIGNYNQKIIAGGLRYEF
jgi:uncharacterized protein with beta-barrel porin domain